MIRGGLEEDIKKRHSGRNVPLTRERGLKKRRTNGSPESFRKAPLYNGRTYLTVAFCIFPRCSFRRLFTLMYDDELYLLHLLCKHLQTFANTWILYKYRVEFWPINDKLQHVFFFKTYLSTNCWFYERNYARILKAIWSDNLHCFGLKNVFDILFTFRIS